MKKGLHIIRAMFPELKHNPALRIDYEVLPVRLSLGACVGIYLRGSFGVHPDDARFLV